MSKVLYGRAPDDLHSRVLERAALEGISVGEVLRRAAEHYLDHVDRCPEQEVLIEATK